MKKILAMAAFMLVAAPAMAGDRCFCSPYTYVPPYQQPFQYSAPYVTPTTYYYDNEELVSKVDVINRQTSISPLKAPEKDMLTEYALKKQWEDVTGVIQVLLIVRFTKADSATGLKRTAFGNYVEAKSHGNRMV